MPDTIVLPRSLVTRLLHQAQSRPDYEVCGLIGARDGKPVNVYPVANVAADPGRHFEMDPAGQIRAMKTMRQRGETLFAIYHSHPHAPPFPSSEDLEAVSYPEALSLIISLNTKGVLEIRGFRLEGRQPEEVELVMEEA
ncbi:[CysO sulfur-carrier protein]-S-L-cysteine hydrolase [Methylomarinovum caldicuralii]|uniref:[CysO sulfur-carrier protein]-S-L-cysteine hydrolase n=1 Tax=Methylomarinovum caldicuralii TaxID=438856 RepID=A0AAU9C0J1_9GAMM|nr:M67 family metallopeptidase [Methylomarinovum caldicuralii]BCX80559.1 [CysO sulfur-carrier protein]-S-L-cysteine hydrolase [Methylomarinovum caldicuralii]